MAEESTQQYLRSIDVNKRLISSIDNGIIILDEELKINYFNKWLEIHTHLKEQDILGKELHAVFPNINITTLQRKIKTALRMGTPTFYIASTSKYLIPIEINQIKASGFDYMRQDVSVIPFDIEKKLISLIITDQTIMTNTNILLESNVKKVQELNKELIAEKNIVNERVIFIKMNNELNITEASRAYLKLLNLDKADIHLENYFKYERLTLSVEVKENMQTHIVEKKVFKFEKISLKNDGREVWLLNTLVPEYDQNGSHIGFIIFGENITSAKLVQEHQKKLLENSRASAMGEMISMIAHQWRQPLSVINTLIATLRIKKELNMLDEHTMNESYTKIEKTVAYLSETIDDFRNFFKKNKELTQTSLKDVFKKANHLLASEMKIFNIEYIEDIDDNIILTTYKNELVQTLINILKNSVDEFKRNTTLKQKIIVKAKVLETHISIKIEDNAGGIPKDTLQKVFEPYFSTKSKNGTGLGLYVCKTIVEEHLKGKITMRSKENNTTTIIELPKILYEETQT